MRSRTASGVACGVPILGLVDPRLSQALFLVIAGYLVGSLPMGVIVARLTGATDPRTVGSGKIGGTNALRAMGARRALTVALLDVAKGALPVLLCIAAGADDLVQALTAVAATLGACRSVFLRFHGGRGVATGVGAALIIQPLAVILAIPVFFAVLWLTRYVALASLLGSTATALLIILSVSIGLTPPAATLFAIGALLLIWLTHADNIARLRAGTESRFDFFDRGAAPGGSRP